MTCAGGTRLCGAVLLTGGSPGPLAVFGFEREVVGGDTHGELQGAGLRLIHLVGANRQRLYLTYFFKSFCPTSAP
jgi:hypothetical protein